MQNESNDFRDKLLAVQEMTPELRDGYRRELDAILYETHTAKSRFPAVTLLVICVGVVAGEIWAVTKYPPSATFYIGAVTMLGACAAAAVWVARDLYRGRSLRRQSFRVPELFYGAASLLTVVTLMDGLSRASEPASMFNAFYVFFFFTVCANWAFSNRISVAELTLKEQTLRLECRLADLAERLPAK